MSQYGSGSQGGGTAGSYGSGSGSGSPPPRRQGLLVILLIFLVLLLITVLLFFFPQSTATVTLTPVSQELSSVGTVNVPSRLLSSAQQGQETGIPTGSGMGATHATGTLTFENYTYSWVTIPADTPVTNDTGQEVRTDKELKVPPDPGMPGVASVSAHVVNIGQIGNIPAMSVNGPCCSDISSGISVLNEAAFSGGRDEQKGPIVQQTDLDTVVQKLKTSLTQKASAGINSQLKRGEQLVNVNPQCETKVTANPGVGQTAAKFTVDVSLTCSATAYSPQVTFPQVEEALKQKASQQLGPSFVLVGRITTKVEKITPDASGVAQLQVSASGTWKYQFTAQSKQAMAKYISGTTIDKAKSWLKQQKGVANVSLSVSGPIINLGRGNILPSDSEVITIDG